LLDRGGVAAQGRPQDLRSNDRLAPYLLPA
jgi:hypothetical protein